ERPVYVGLVRGQGPGGFSGLAGSNENAALAAESAVRFGVERNYEVVAHETGHALRRNHIANPTPKPSACYADPGGPDLFWPYNDSTIQEPGFDLSRTYGLDGPREILVPQLAYEMMSYCEPRWISPYIYKKLVDKLKVPAAAA